MSDFTVTADQLKQKRSELTTMKINLTTRTNQFELSGKSLQSMWSGDAKEEYDKTFTRDVQKLREFIKIIDKFLNLLDEIEQNYRNTEMKNKALAGSN